MTIKLPVIGIDMYCPDCGRVLVTYNGNGTGNLSPKAEVKTIGTPWEDDDGHLQPPSEAVVTEAICHLRSCRVKRRIRNIRNRARRK